jgi:hypothetical protein
MPFGPTAYRQPEDIDPNNDRTRYFQMGGQAKGSFRGMGILRPPPTGPRGVRLRPAGPPGPRSGVAEQHPKVISGRAWAAVEAEARNSQDARAASSPAHRAGCRLGQTGCRIFHPTAYAHRGRASP